MSEMTRRFGWSAGGARRALGGVAALACAALLAGCVTDANVASGRGATLTFESVDGPPQPVFDRLVAQLDAEAKARNIAVVSRAGDARYRVRAYLAAAVARGATTIEWVWDVYNAAGQRVARLAGQEPAGPATKDAWAATSDAVLERIAETGMAQLASLTAAANAGSVSPEPSVAQPVEAKAVAPAASGSQSNLRVASAASAAAQDHAAH